MVVFAVLERIAYVMSEFRLVTTTAKQKRYKSVRREGPSVLPGRFHSSHFGAWDKIVDGFVLLVLVVLSDDHLSLEKHDKQMLIDIDRPSLRITLVWFLSNIETPSRSSCPTEIDNSIVEKQSDRAFEDLQEENVESYKSMSKRRVRSLVDSSSSIAIASR